MSAAEESPAQKAARLRRERREAKIRDGGAARLDKITSLSGRTPASTREEALPSPSPRPAATPTPPPSLPEPRAQPTTTQAPIQHVNDQTPSPETLQAQQEYIRALLRANPPDQPQPGPGGNGLEDDPTMKLLGSLLGGAGGMPGAPPGAPGGSSDLNTADIASALGLPPFLAKMMGAATQKETPEQKRQVVVWKVLHTVFALTLAVYLLFVMGSAVATYGSQPPPPATAQNPFVAFLTGEMVLSGARILMKSSGGNAGLGMWVQLFRDVIRDGSILLFLFGMASWWYQGWEAY